MIELLLTFGAAAFIASLWPFLKRLIEGYRKQPAKPEASLDLSPDINDLNKLARSYHEQQRYTEAESLYQRALAISEKALGPEHPGTAATLNNLAVLYRELGRQAEAEPLL
jgi:tetratricopeptide (TPR) repeat protein